MNFCTLFLKAENVHLMKDVGQIPSCLKKEFGYETCLVTYKNGEYSYLKNEAEGLKLQFVKKTAWGKIIDGLIYLYKHRKDIDILNIYHLNLSSFVWIFFFRMIRKKGALSYLKLDANHMEIEKMRKLNVKGVVKRITIANADIVSAETSAIKTALQKYCKKEILYIPNGYMKVAECQGEESRKDNLILTVGRLGSHSKATELLVEAFLKAHISNDWKLVLVGPSTEEFTEWMNTMLTEYPELKDCVLIPGAIEDKEILRGWYQHAKVFVLPSRYESFGIVLVEAAMAGCYLITSDTVLAANDLIQDTQMGMVFSNNSVDELSSAIKQVTQMKINWDINAKRIIQMIEEKYLWKNILKTLNQRIISDVEQLKCGSQK